MVPKKMDSSIYSLLTSIYIYMDEKNRKEERRSGTTGTGVSQKDLQIKKTRCYELVKNEKKRALCEEKLGRI